MDERPGAGGTKASKVYQQITHREARSTDCEWPSIAGQEVTLAAASASTTVMTSREIAELTGKRHDNVMRDIRTMLADLVQGGLLNSEAGYIKTWRHPQNGQEHEEFALPKDLTITLVSGYSTAMRHRIVTRWQQLEADAADPVKVLSDPAKLRQVLLSYAERALSLEATVQAQAPKVVYADALLGAEGDISIRDAAKSLGLPIMKTYEALRAKKVLNADRLPAARYIEKGYFRVRPVAGNNGKVYPTTRVTMLGIEWLRRFWIKNFPPQFVLGEQGNLP